MSETEMIDLFHQRFDASSFTNDDLGDDEVYLYLNSGQDEFVKTKFTGNNPRKVPFEGDQKRIDDLKALLITSSTITGTGASVEIPNSDEYALPGDYMYHVATNVEVTRTDIDNTNKYAQCEIISNDDIRKYVSNGHNNPIIRQPKIVFRGNDKFTIIGEPNTTLGDAKITYLKQFVEIESGTDCELDDHTHREVVGIAVSLALKDVESRRAQTNETEYNRMQ